MFGDASTPLSGIGIGGRKPPLKPFLLGLSGELTGVGGRDRPSSNRLLSKRHTTSGVTQQSSFDVAHNINVNPTLTHLIGDVLLVSFCPEGFVGIGVCLFSAE